MYWQKRLDRTASTQIIEEEIQAIRKKHQHYGYRRITQELKRRGFQVNKKKVQRLIQKLKLQVKAFTKKSRKYNSYKGIVGKIAKNLIRRRFKTSVPHQKLQLIQLNLSTLKQITQASFVRKTILRSIYGYV